MIIMLLTKVSLLLLIFNILLFAYVSWVYIRDMATPSKYIKVLLVIFVAVVLNLTAIYFFHDIYTLSFLPFIITFMSFSLTIFVKARLKSIHKEKVRQRFFQRKVVGNRNENLNYNGRSRHTRRGVLHNIK